MGLSCSTFRLLPDGLSGAPGGIASRSAPASAGTPPAGRKTEAPGKRVPRPGLWLQEQQEQQGRHPPSLEAPGSQSSPCGAPPALPPALPRALLLPLPPMPWLPGRRSQAAACPRSGAEVGVCPWLAQTLGGLGRQAGWEPGLTALLQPQLCPSPGSAPGLLACWHPCPGSCACAWVWDTSPRLGPPPQGTLIRAPGSATTHLAGS